MKWIKERDDLIAQTRAFVQSVAGRKPPVVVRPVFAEPNPVEGTIARATAEPTSALPAIDSFAATPPPTEPIEPTIEPTLTAVALQSDVRKEIQNRVAAFKAHQHRFHREREAYFNAVLTKARSSAEISPNGPSS